MSAVRDLFGKPWIWSYLGALLVWATTVAYTGGKGGGDLASAALTFGTFFAIVGIAQMFVVTLGPGNVDLSIPANMTLAATVSMKVMAGANAMIPVGLAIALVVGGAVGCFNYGLIRILRIPPIIATLSASFIFQSAAIWYNRGLRVKPPAMLADFTFAKIGGVPVLAICVMVLAVIMTVVLDRTVFGRSVISIGQNERAARLAGVATEFVKFATYVQCAVLAALGFSLNEISFLLDLRESHDGSCADAHALAQHLPPCGHLLNVCQDRYRFAVGFTAGLLAPKAQLLSEMAKLDSRRNVVSELAALFWVPKALVCFQLQDILRSGERPVHASHCLA